MPFFNTGNICCELAVVPWAALSPRCSGSSIVHERIETYKHEDLHVALAASDQCHRSLLQDIAQGRGLLLLLPSSFDLHEIHLSSRRQSLQKQARALLVNLPRVVAADPVEAERVAQLALGLAQRASDPLLVAESLRLHGMAHSGSVDASDTFEAMRNASAIFRANGMVGRALSCEVRAAMALHELAQERNAIVVAQAALREPALESPDRVAAYTVLALCHSHFGELDAALDFLHRGALPIARDCKDARALTRATYAYALTNQRIMVLDRFAGVWNGRPSPGPVTAPVPTPAQVLRLYDAAEAALPAGERWLFIDMGRHYVRGLTEISSASATSVAALARIAQDCLATDVQAAAWAWMCQGALFLKQGEANLSLQAFHRALGLAKPANLRRIVREVMQQSARAHEALGHHAEALEAYRRYFDWLSQSLRLDPELVVPGLTGSDLSRTGESSPPLAVLRARTFMDKEFRSPISILQIVHHSKVSRRTLELAFKESCGCTLREYLRNLRLDSAAKALSLTTQPVADIAAAVGYGSPDSLARDFVARFGKPPNQWRLASRKRFDPT